MAGDRYVSFALKGGGSVRVSVTDNPPDSLEGKLFELDPLGPKTARSILSYVRGKTEQSYTAYEV